jgi:hypothetical protein
MEDAPQGHGRRRHHVVLAFLAILVFAACLAVGWWPGVVVAIAHTAYVLALSLRLVEILLAGAAIERWMWDAPWRFALVPAAMWAAWRWNHRQAGEAGELEERLLFENSVVRAVTRLDLSARRRPKRHCPTAPGSAG